MHLDETPRTIEGIDIAHLAGRQTVASLVQFIDGLPFKPGYRRLRIRGVAGVDDFASIHEAVARRFQRLAEERTRRLAARHSADRRRQGATACGAGAPWTRLSVRPPTVISLAKREEEIYVAGGRGAVAAEPPRYALRLLQYVRDEAHRFAQHYHHLLRKKSALETDREQ